MPAQDRTLVPKLFGELATRYQSRPGGYTRVLRCGFRKGRPSFSPATDHSQQATMRPWRSLSTSTTRCRRCARGRCRRLTLVRCAAAMDGVTACRRHHGQGEGSEAARGLGRAQGKAVVLIALCIARSNSTAASNWSASLDAKSHRLLHRQNKLVQQLRGACSLQRDGHERRTCCCDSNGGRSRRLKHVCALGRLPLLADGTNSSVNFLGPCDPCGCGEVGSQRRRAKRGDP